MLAIDHLLAAKLNFVATLVPTKDLVSLVAASPDDQICFLDVLALLLRSLCADKLDTWLFLNVTVHIFGITAEASVPIEDTTLFWEHMVIVVFVVVFLCMTHSVIENANSVAMNNLDASWAQMLWEIL